MNHHLVVTAMGHNRPGITNQITQLVSQCQCNILDSRMAIFGNEFTLIMLLSGTWQSILQIEALLPEKTLSLELLTIIKRTQLVNNPIAQPQLEVHFQGPDKIGSMEQITQRLAEQDIDLASIRSFSDAQTQQNIYLTLNLTEFTDQQSLTQSLTALAEQLALSIQINSVTQSV